jgi:hypothetical protein
MSNAYLEGYIAAENGEPRECIDPWNAKWLAEWLHGYDTAHEMKRHNALTMLAGCPDGATEAALGSHGFSASLLDELVAKRLAFVRTERFVVPRGLTVRRFFITAAGRSSHE